MRALAAKIKPKGGFANLIHIGLLLLLPLVLFVLIRIQFVPLAVAVVLLGKWRMLAVRARYWFAHLRANAVDIIVGLSIIVFMDHAPSASWQLVWAAVYGIWLVVIKPGSSTLKVSLQALIGQLFGLMALFIFWGDAPLIGLVGIVWFVCYFSARHFFMSFDEPYASLLAHIWGYFGASLMWVLGHWLLFYGVLAQPTLLLTIIGYGAAAIYYLDQTERLSALWRRQFIFIMMAVVTVVLVFSDWGDKVV